MVASDSRERFEARKPPLADRHTARLHAQQHATQQAPHKQHTSRRTSTRHYARVNVIQPPIHRHNAGCRRRRTGVLPNHPGRFGLPICAQKKNQKNPGPTGVAAPPLPGAERALSGCGSWKAAFPDVWSMPWPSSGHPRVPWRAALPI